MREAIGPLLEAWDGLVAALRETYAPDEDFAFMVGKTYGWALRDAEGRDKLCPYRTHPDPT